MKFPNISTPQVAVLHCDAATGEVLDEKFNLFTNENQNCYKVFDSMELVKPYLEKTIKPMRNVEIIVYDALKKEVFYYTPNKD